MVVLEQPPIIDEAENEEDIRQQGEIHVRVVATLEQKPHLELTENNSSHKHSLSLLSGCDYDCKRCIIVLLGQKHGRR